MFPSKRKSSKRKSYNKAKRERTVTCPCGGSYVDTIKTSLPLFKHEKTKMHKDYVSNGVMNSQAIAKVAKKEAEKVEALQLKRDSQTLCGCGSFFNKRYVDGGRGEMNHLETAKHSKWAIKNI